MTERKFYYWKDKSGYFKTETPFIEDYEGLRSASPSEYIEDFFINKMG